MTERSSDTQLRRTLATLAEIQVIPKATPELDRLREVALDVLQKTVIEEVPAFAASGNPDVLPDFAMHAGLHVAEIRRLFGGGTTGDFAFVREQAARRAEQRFPLESILHAYRVGHKVLSRWLRNGATVTAEENLQQAISAVADFAIEYTNTISTIAAAEYVAQTRRIAEVEGDRRTELLNLLLEGFDESDGRVARLLRRAGYLEQRQSYCVVVSQPTDPTEMDNPARAQRLLNAIAEAVAETPVRSLLGIRDNQAIGIFSSTRRVSGWTALQTTLAERLQQPLRKLGPAVLIGVSSDQPSTAYIPLALDNAQLALDFATVDNRVVQYADIPLRPIMLRAMQDQSKTVFPAWVDTFLQANKKSRGSLFATVRAYADANMNVLKAAKALSVHPNTIYSRVKRITDLTGHNAFSFHELNELLLAIDCKD